MSSDKSTRWQNALIEAVTDPKELIQLLELDESFIESARAAAAMFPLKVPRAFIARIKKGDINDPLLRQVLPLGIELEPKAGYTTDPLEEANANPIPGLLHKYRGRVLLTLVGTCGVNCRYCFRRHFPYEKNNPGTAGWEKALDYVANDKSISEVILSGGDPLVVSDHLLRNFSQKLAGIPHIKRLRIHSRMPIVIPERITPEFIDWIKEAPFKTIIVIHSNHPQEIDSTVERAMATLTNANIALLNQSVLLKGVNDSTETLVALSERLFAVGVLPYYLHTLDRIQGAAHYDLDRETALQLHWAMAQQLPGYLVPKLVCEQAGAPAKIPVFNKEFYTG